MYANPVHFEVAVAEVAKRKGAPKVWSPMEWPTEWERLKDLCKGFKTPEFGITPDFGIPLEDFEGRNGRANEVAV